MWTQFQDFESDTHFELTQQQSTSHIFMFRMVKLTAIPKVTLRYDRKHTQELDLEVTSLCTFFKILLNC